MDILILPASSQWSSKAELVTIGIGQVEEPFAHSASRGAVSGR
jgi:hypothetical protein